MERQGVRAWSVHEMLGVFDLLVEAWLPAAVTETTFEQELERTFKENLILRDSFSTSEVVAHWAWGEPEKRQMRVPPAEALATPPTPRQMARIVGGGDRKLLRRYQELDVVRWIAGEKGICFLLLVSMQRALPLLSLEARAVVKELMLRHGGRLGEAGVAGSSLLRGFGFADYVLQGRIEPHSFPELREVMRPLQEDLRAIGMRTHTFVLSTEVELAGETGLSGGLEGEERTSVKDLLQQGESERFQVRLTAMTDLLPDRGLGASGSSSQATELLMKTITGMLNGESGNIVIGVLPRDRGLGDPRLTGRLEDAPALGRYLLLGVDAEIPKGTDSLLQKVRQACNSFIEPDPAPYLQLRTEVIEGKTLLVVSVERPSGEWFYYMSGPGRAEFIVQTKTGRRALLGPEGDAYKAAHPRAG